MPSHWNYDNIPDQSGRISIVTGSNTGIGYETARMLCLKGARVVLACRSAEKGQAAVDKILSEKPLGSAEFQLLDLSDLESVESFAKDFSGKNDKIDLLILNAGVMVPPESKTKQGYELQFGVNHLGHFALTGHLLHMVQASDKGRVVVVSSTAANFGKIDFDDLNFTKRGYDAWPAYGQSKLANQLFALELQRRLDKVNSTILVSSAHPGWTQTDLQRSSLFARTLNPLVAMNPEQGALPTLRAATDPEAPSGSYFGPDGLWQMRGYPIQVDFVKQANDETAAAKLWEVSEELTGVRYEFK